MIKTKIVRIDPLRPNEEYIREAADILANGGLVIIPTETVYGIAANMLNKKAIDRLYEIKKRPRNKPFSLHIDSKEKIEEYARDISVAAYKVIDEFLPGPVTVILKSRDKQDTIGIRIPDDEIALRVIAWANVPVVCPSANISGNSAPISFTQAIKDLEGLVDFAIDAGTTNLKAESLIVDFTTEPLTILREGAIKGQDIERVTKRKTVLFVCTGNSCRSVMAKGLLEKRLKGNNRDNVEVLSAGIMMLGGLGATQQTIELLRREGIDVSSHRSQAITKNMIKKSDIILVMERIHEQRILQLVPEVKNRLFLLKEFAMIGDNDLDIIDPIGRPIEFYEETFALIKEAIERVSKII